MRDFFSKIWDRLVRWRTWVVNVLFGAILTPDMILALLGFDWSLIIPPRYMPAITLGIVVLNVWMRPRAAVRADDPEAQVNRLNREGL